MRDLQRDKWLLEKEFQVWRAATQSEHDSLEDRYAELEATMETLSQHNQSMEQELRHVRHALSLRTVNTGDVPHPFHTPPSPDYSEGMGGPQDSRPESPASQHLCGEEGEESTREEEIAEMNQEAEEEESRECSKEEDDFELSLRSDSSGSGDDPRPPDATSAPPQCVDGTEEPLLGEDTGGGDCEEETLCGRSQEDHQGSASEEEDEGEEEQLCELQQVHSGEMCSWWQRKASEILCQTSYPW
ncbi:dystrotelin [Clupea harengus]|uniref:Dystrotelin n=1 Tax=Clupea harengus TaxID=7950 RepID=A0A6P8GJU3_CLUHA|nr:dystrotelin [Clupea harengus]